MKADADGKPRSQTIKGGQEQQSSISKTIQTIHNLNVYLVPAFEQYLGQLNQTMKMFQKLESKLQQEFKKQGAAAEESGEEGEKSLDEFHSKL